MNRRRQHRPDFQWNSAARATATTASQNPRQAAVRAQPHDGCSASPSAAILTSGGIAYAALSRRPVNSITERRIPSDARLRPEFLWNWRARHEEPVSPAAAQAASAVALRPAGARRRPAPCLFQHLPIHRRQPAQWHGRRRGTGHAVRVATCWDGRLGRLLPARTGPYRRTAATARCPCRRAERACALYAAALNAALARNRLMALISPPLDSFCFDGAPVATSRGRCRRVGYEQRRWACARGAVPSTGNTPCAYYFEGRPPDWEPELYPAA